MISEMAKKIIESSRLNAIYKTQAVVTGMMLRFFHNEGIENIECLF